MRIDNQYSSKALAAKQDLDALAVLVDATVDSVGVTVAIVTDDVFVRGLVTAVSWMGAHVRSFPWPETPRALAWLGLAEQETALLDLVERLKDE